MKQFDSKYPTVYPYNPVWVVNLDRVGFLANKGNFFA
ncbi:unnamed protein product, partial [marine sediment metagenome]